MSKRLLEQYRADRERQQAEFEANRSAKKASTITEEPMDEEADSNPPGPWR